MWSAQAKTHAREPLSGRQAGGRAGVSVVGPGRSTAHAVGALALFPQSPLPLTRMSPPDARLYERLQRAVCLGHGGRLQTISRTLERGNGDGARPRHARSARPAGGSSDACPQPLRLDCLPSMQQAWSRRWDVGAALAPRTRAPRCSPPPLRASQSVLVFPSLTLTFCIAFITGNFWPRRGVKFRL